MPGVRREWEGKVDSEVRAKSRCNRLQVADHLSDEKRPNWRLLILRTRHANGALAASHKTQPNSFKAKPECQILVM